MSTAMRISVPRSTAVTEVVYQLLLSETEAEFLIDLLRDVGGDPKESARKYAQDMLIELVDLLGEGTRRFARADGSACIAYAAEANLP
ncbi:hypothetical protein [Xanthomonas tesorieronis]|uniref:hypothetical protein n=1 Tax=Xanthomonas tesorieronis TaxID=3160839 RepID=UPI003514E7F5